jgi:hypothetical protein
VLDSCDGDETHGVRVGLVAAIVKASERGPRVTGRGTSDGGKSLLAIPDWAALVAAVVSMAHVIGKP